MGIQLWDFNLQTRERRVVANHVGSTSTEMHLNNDVLWDWNTIYDLRTGVVIDARPPNTANSPYFGYLINNAFVRVVTPNERPRYLAIIRLERGTTSLK
ncbi:MAG: hypothetical protein R2911_17225 [Caldilineaceae bacterium]